MLDPWLVIIHHACSYFAQEKVGMQISMSKLNSAITVLELQFTRHGTLDTHIGRNNGAKKTLGEWQPGLQAIICIFIKQLLQ